MTCFKCNKGGTFGESKEQLSTHKPRLIYDGVCNLCTGAVRLLIAIDRNHAVEYTPYQILGTNESRTYGLSTSELEGRMHIVQSDGSVARGVTAIAEVCKLLSPIIALCELFNTPLAQRLYDALARRRYRVFGCRDSCYVPVVRETGR